MTSWSYSLYKRLKKFHKLRLQITIRLTFCKKTKFVTLKMKIPLMKDSPHEDSPHKMTIFKKVTLLMHFLKFSTFNPFALRKAKIVYNFGLSECKRVKVFYFTLRATTKFNSSPIVTSLSMYEISRTLKSLFV